MFEVRHMDLSAFKKYMVYGELVVTKFSVEVLLKTYE